MANKFYAVKIGRNKGIFQTWDECKKQVDGFSNSKYKAFKTLEEAEEYLNNEEEMKSESEEEIDIDTINEEIENKINNLQDDEVIAFVDGTYLEENNVSGYGVIIIKNKIETESLYKSFTENTVDEEFLEGRNVTAELEAAKEAINWAIDNHKKKITIYYDYEGIEKFIDGSWEPSKTYSKNYKKFYESKKKVIKINYKHVKSHVGIKYNEDADALASKAILNKGYRTYKDGSVYFYSLSLEDWKNLLSNSSLNTDDETITTQFETKDKYTKIIVQGYKEKVNINCYLDKSNSYLQGKQSLLFNIIFNKALESLKNEDMAIEVLNNYYSINIAKDEITNRLTLLVPNLKLKDTEIKFTNLLYQAVFNLNISSSMYDFSFLAIPAFRILEYILHRIIGDKMGLSTTDKYGRVYFPNFKYDKVNKKYFFDNSLSNVLNNNQLELLNKVFNYRNKIRSIYVHTSKNDIDIALISNAEEIRKIIENCLKLLDEYYVLF